MEGIGSRTGRPSSRYGSAPVFTGPVRRWQKQWVHVSSSSSSVSYNHSNNFNSNGSNNNNISAVRIRRWTPVPSDQSGGDMESAEERPRRKLRYAPIVVLEGKKKEAEKADLDVKEASKTNRSVARGTSENDDNEKRSFDNVLAAKAQAAVDQIPSTSQNFNWPLLQAPEKSAAAAAAAAATKDLNNHPMDLGIALKGHDEDHDSGGANKVADWVKAAQRGFAR